MMVKSESASEHAWLFVARINSWQRIINNRSFGVKRNSAPLKEAQPGDCCVAYVSGQGRKFFAGLGKITQGYYYDKLSDFPYRVGLEVKLNLTKGVPLDSTKNALQFIKDKNNPGKDLRWAVRRIPLDDYEVIKARLKLDTQEKSEKLAEREGHELISIPIEAIDTHTNDIHTKAEGALLELGNCLEEYETYVTPDDRNKKFRDKSLAEIATLWELPEDFIPPGVKDTVRHIDIIWFKKKVPAYCFEVEHSTNITQALARFSDLRGLTTEFIIVAPAKAHGKFKKEVERALFVNIKDRVRFKSYDELAKFLAVAQEFARRKQNFFGH